MMDIPALEDLLDRHGGDPDAWPVALRPVAMALIGESAPARRMFEAMRDVERVLRPDLGPPADPGDALAARAMRHLQERPVVRAKLSPRNAGWATAAAVAALMFGVAVGDIAPIQHDDGPEKMLAAAFDTTGAIDAD